MAELSISALSNSTYTINSQIRRAEAKQPNSIMVELYNNPTETTETTETSKTTETTKSERAFYALNLPQKTIIIEEGDNLGSIADKLELKPQDLTDQLKDQGLLPDDFEWNQPLQHNLKFMKPGKKLTLQCPQTNKQKEEYEVFYDKRTHEHYNRLKATVAKGKNGYSVTKDAEKKHKYYDNKGKEISPKAFKKACPNMYKQFPPNGTKEEKESSGFWKFFGL